MPESIALFTVQSGSMAPKLDVGSVVLTMPTQDLISPLPSERYSVGDIITYKQRDSVVTHRIIEVIEKDKEFYYQTRGDANIVSDISQIRESEIIGEVVAQAPYIGKIFAYTKHPLGFLTMILIPSIYIMAGEAMVIIGELKRSGQNNHSLSLDI